MTSTHLSEGAPMIHIDPEPLLTVFDRDGWTQGHYEAEDGSHCMHGCIRVCELVPGDAALIERVANRQGWGTDWNDRQATIEMVRARLAQGVDITDEDLADTFGKQWQAVVNIVRRAAVLTEDEQERLAAAQGARVAARVAAWTAARVAAWTAAWDAAWTAVRDAARDAAWDAAGDAAGAVVTWDLATADGPYTVAQRGLLIAPWVKVCGLPEGLVEP